MRRPDDSTGVIVQAGERRLAPIESMRALAALGVLLWHAQLLSVVDNGIFDAATPNRIAASGANGVYVFFTLTGYLIFRPFAQRAWGSGVGVDLRRYARNRLLRVLPLYYVAVVVLLVLQEHGGTGRQWWRFLLFAQNYWADTNQKVDGPLWSIVVELQFYVVVPLLAALLARGTRRAGGLALLALFAVGLAGRLVAEAQGVANDNIWKTTFVVTFVWFTPGLLLAWLETCWAARRPLWLTRPLDSSTAWFVAGVALWLTAPILHAPADIYLAANALLVGSCALPLRHGWSYTALSWRPLATVGVASYSLYVWHVPIMRAIDGWPLARTGSFPLSLVAVPVCIAAALVSYRLIERPFLRHRRRWSDATATVDAAPVQPPPTRVPA